MIDPFDPYLPIPMIAPSVGVLLGFYISYVTMPNDLLLKKNEFLFVSVFLGLVIPFLCVNGMLIVQFIRDCCRKAEEEEIEEDDDASFIDTQDQILLKEPPVDVYETPIYVKKDKKALNAVPKKKLEMSGTEETSKLNIIATSSTDPPKVKARGILSPTTQNSEKNSHRPKRRVTFSEPEESYESEERTSSPKAKIKQPTGIGGGVKSLINKYNSQLRPIQVPCSTAADSPTKTILFKRQLGQSVSAGFIRPDNLGSVAS